jgi:predicted acyltransferase
LAANQKDLLIMAKRTAESASKRSALPDESTPADSGRIVAIDALRGFDMFWIVGGRELVITFVEIFKKPVPQWLERQLEHVRWTGSTVWDSFTAWDLIMPLFLFVVGAAMPFSFSRRLEQGQSKGQLYAKIVRRTVILFVLGMAVQGNLLDFKLDSLHVFANTLQAIAVGYLIAALVMLNVGIIGQIVFTAAMLIGFWLLMMYVPLAGHDAGSLDEHANVALTVDQFVLGRFIDGTDPPYTWVLSGMTFAASVLLGVFSGHILRSRLRPSARLLALTLSGLACLGAGWAWAEWLGFPIIKHIWTSSMVLWAAGWSYLLVALFYLVIDIVGLRRWAFPFIVIGMNAIVIYVAWHFIPFTAIAKGIVGGLAAHLGPVGPFLIALTAVLLWWLVLYDLYRRKIYLRL